MTYDYKKFKELQREIRKSYLEDTGKKTIPADYNQGVNDALKYVLEFFTLIPYKSTGVFCVKKDSIDR